MSQSDSSNADLSKALKGRTPTLSVIAMPADTNYHGNIFGGWLMSQMDLAAAHEALIKTQLEVVTRGAQISFDRPVQVGDRLDLYTEIGRVGNTSIMIKIQAWALRRKDRAYEQVAQGEYTFVAIDKNKKKVPIILRPPGP